MQTDRYYGFMCSAPQRPCDHLQAGLLHPVPDLGHVGEPRHQLPVVRLQLRQLLVPGRPPRPHPRPVPAARQVVPPLQISPEVQRWVRSCYTASVQDGEWRRSRGRHPPDSLQLCVLRLVRSWGHVWGSSAGKCVKTNTRSVGEGTISVGVTTVFCSIVVTVVHVEEGLQLESWEHVLAILTGNFSVEVTQKFKKF